MINAVIVTNYLGESIKLELRSPEKSGFSVQEITGLGPVRANINLTEFATSDGGQFNSARLSARNIVFRMKLLSKPNIETVRQLSYKYFPVKKTVRLLFETDNRICEIYGNVEANEPNIFSNFETTQISIICPDPYFYSSGIAGNTITVFSGIQPMFEFPFSNESLTDSLIILGDMSADEEKTVLYEGDSEIGFVIYIHAMGPATNITVYNVRTRESMVIDTDKLTALTGSGLVAGDDIIVTTVKGRKSAFLLRDGVYINILNCLNKYADWFQLTKGDNIFAYSAETGNLNLQFRIENQTAYEGV